VFVEFASNVELIISATFMGRGPVAEHQRVYPEATTKDGRSKIILGKANEGKSEK